MSKPDPAPIGVEELMEAQDLPESDRDEVRRFAEFMRWKAQRLKDKAEGKKLRPVPKKWRDYILGND